MEQEPRSHDRSWAQKFRNAFRGTKRGVRGESSFFVHFFVAAAVATTAVALEASLAEWYLLIGCVAAVLTVEMLNTAIECMAKAVDDKFNAHLRDALDIGSAAVLFASIGAAIIGGLILGRRLGMNLGWW